MVFVTSCMHHTISITDANSANKNMNSQKTKTRHNTSLKNQNNTVN